MELFGRHKVTIEGIRSQAIYCHALDIGAHHLLVDTTHADGIEQTKQSYEEMFANHLLLLAICIRTKCYQGVDASYSPSRISACGLLYRGSQDDPSPRSFTIKDVCDKIIHADTMQRSLEHGIPKPITKFKGTHKKATWELHISVSLFTEVVLDWLQTL